MKDIGYGANYAYDHNDPDGFSGANYWPEGMPPRTFYRPVERGFEREVLKRIEWWDKRRAERRGE
jgi:putative ATPase